MEKVVKIRDIYSKDDRVRILVSREEDEFMVYEYKDFE